MAIFHFVPIHKCRLPNLALHKILSFLSKSAPCHAISRRRPIRFATLSWHDSPLLLLSPQGLTGQVQPHFFDLSLLSQWNLSKFQPTLPQSLSLISHCLVPVMMGYHRSGIYLHVSTPDIPRQHLAMQRSHFDLCIFCRAR